MLQATEPVDAAPMNFSRPLSRIMGDAQQSSQGSQLPERPPQLSLQIPDEDQVVVDSLDGNTLSSSATTLQEPADQLDFQHLSLANGTAGLDMLANNKQQGHEVLGSSSSSDRTSSMQTPSPRKLVKKARYYSHALSDEDKQALIVGEKNHNLKEWTPKDLVNHHESRSALLPHGMEKPDKTHAPADIDQDTQQSQRSLSKLADKENEPTYTETQQSSQSLHDLRSSSMPPPQLPPISLTPLLFPDHPPLELRAVHTRASSSGDYFSRTPGAPSSHPSSGRNSGTSSRVRSPLSKEFQPFQHNPQTTFDAFLAPHKLGKGEAYRDSDNAKKPKTPKNSPVGSPKTSLRRLSKMPSMPSLRKWSPQPDTSAEE